MIVKFHLSHRTAPQLPSTQGWLDETGRWPCALMWRARKARKNSTPARSQLSSSFLVLVLGAKKKLLLRRQRRRRRVVNVHTYMCSGTHTHTDAHSYIWGAHMHIVGQIQSTHRDSKVTWTGNARSVAKNQNKAQRRQRQRWQQKQRKHTHTHTRTHIYTDVGRDMHIPHTYSYPNQAANAFCVCCA